MDDQKLNKSKLKVLCLEDSPMDAQLIYENLSKDSRYEIQMDLVSKEEDFISAIKLKKYELILADFMLPGFDGFAALKHVKSISPSTPFICVSGFIGEETAVELLKQGATDYVSKNKLGRLIFSIERSIKELKAAEEKERQAAELAIINKELTIQNEKILYISHHDYLTGLYNRTFFEEEQKRLDTVRQLPISIIMGDVNGLKLINDGFGHHEGDRVLIETGKILKSCCRSEDIISRIGGDEFAILLPQTDSQSAQLVCSRIYDTCKEYVSEDSLIPPSISLGYATKTDETMTIDETLKAAEENMYKHKLLENKSAHSSILVSLKAIMFEKSQETEEHAERMMLLSKEIGLALGLTDSKLNELELLCALHDIGKMSISSEILGKQDKLSEEEWVEVRKHPAAGFRIAQSTSELSHIADYILCHHERWDGKGYPQGLAGDNIPLLSRILAIVDSFDAMTNDRPYRPALTREEAMEEIRKNSGTQFDPELAQLFLEIMSHYQHIKHSKHNITHNRKL